MSDQTGKRRAPVVGRRKLIAAAGLAVPMFFIRNGWAAGKSMYIGTYTGQQGDYIRRQVVPAFQSEFACKVLQTENVTLGNIGILRTQQANPHYSAMLTDTASLPLPNNDSPPP